MVSKILNTPPKFWACDADEAGIDARRNLRSVDGYTHIGIQDSELGDRHMRALVAVYHLHTYTHKGGKTEVGGGVGERD